MKFKRRVITIVIPVYNEEGNILPFLHELKKWTSKEYDFVYLFVDDGSTDDTLAKLRLLSLKEKNLKYISFTRNFGHQYALKAGIDCSFGDAVITLDGDFEHPPRIIPEMINIWNKGKYKIVYTQRLDIEEVSYFKRISSRYFYRLINSMSDSQIALSSADFRLLDNEVVEIIKRSSESTIFLRGLVAWTGYPSTSITYRPEKRIWGKSKYTYSKMIRLAADAITSFSIFPLRIATIVGLGMAATSSLYGIYALSTWISNREVVLGWSSVIVSVLFIGGIQLTILGIIGEYIGKIFLETKNRPLYLIGESKL